MTNTLFLSSEDQTGVSKSAFCWWRTLDEEFDENGHYKVDIFDLSNLTPRLRVVREMERLALIAGEGLDELRHRLISYRAGDFFLPVGGINKDEMDIPPVITFLLTGFTGAGKSAFVNIMYSVLGRSGAIPFALTSPGESSNPTTMYLEEHNVLRSPRSGFCVFDTRGLDQTQMEEGLEDVRTWITAGVQHNQPCFRPHDRILHGFNNYAATQGVTSARFIKRKANCVMVVADLTQIHKSFKSEDMKSIQALKDLFQFSAIKNSNENPILILTHGDALNAEDRINGRLRICEYLGILESSGAYDIPCLTEQGIVAEECDPVTAIALTEAVYRALLQSDRSHLPKRKLKDWISMGLSWIIMCIAAFFAVLARFFSQFEHHNKKLQM